MLFIVFFFTFVPNMVFDTKEQHQKNIVNKNALALNFILFSSFILFMFSYWAVNQTPDE